jgi:ribosome-associated protein
MSNTIEFKLEGTEYIELKNLLKVSGLCETGGAAKAAIDEGQVSVDGVPEKRKGLKLKPGQVVSYLKKKIIVKS